MSEPSLNNQLQCTVVIVAEPVSGTSYFWNQQYQHSRFAKIVLKDKWNWFSILHCLTTLMVKTPFWAGTADKVWLLPPTGHSQVLFVGVFFFFLGWMIILWIILCCTLVFPDKHKTGSVLWCGKNLLMVEETLLKKGKKKNNTNNWIFRALLFWDLNSTAWSSNVFALSSCLSQDFLTARNWLPQDFLSVSCTWFDPKCQYSLPTW